MFRLGVLTDSHGNEQMLRRAAAALQGVDACAHLGDFARDARLLSDVLSAPVWSVRGNCDYFGAEPEEMVQRVGGARLLLLHGHRLGVKEGLYRLSLRARQLEARLVLYGHTHMPTREELPGLTLFNPGAARDGRYGVVEFSGSDITTEFKQI